MEQRVTAGQGGGGLGGGQQGYQPASRYAGSQNSGEDALARLSRFGSVDALEARAFVPRSLKKKEVFVIPPPTPAPPKVNTPRRGKMAELYRSVTKCDACPCFMGRTKVVFGAGNADGKLFVIGDSPSDKDNAAGLPFQGEAGELFQKIMARMELDIGKDVFATYLQKCRGSGFDKDHAAACKMLIDKQIDIVEPKVILIFGHLAANALLGGGGDSGLNIEQLRTAELIYKDTPVIVTYDLPLMLKDTQYRHGAWEDMKRVLDILS